VGNCDCQISKTRYRGIGCGINEDLSGKVVEAGTAGSTGRKAFKVE
jgi:hypothetical protein